jgi:hypothetical protein
VHYVAEQLLHKAEDVDTDAASLFWFLVPWVLVPGALLVLSFWSPTKRQVLRWGAACDVAVTGDNEMMIRSRLGRSRRFRSAASFPFWWLAGARIINADFPPVLATPVIAMAAYLIGALVAELTGPLVVPSGLRRASLSPRLVAEYRPKWLLRLIITMFGIAALATVLRFTVVDDPSGNARGLATTLCLAVTVVVVAEVAARSIVRRPQRGGSHDLLAADEGLRAAAVSMTSGASLLAGIGAASVASTSAVPAAIGAWAWLLIPWMLALQGSAAGVFALIVRQETWGYRRRFTPAETMAPA